MNIKLFIQNNKKWLLIAGGVILLTILIIIIWPKSKPITDQDRVNIAVDSAIAPLKRQIELNSHTNDSLLKASKARDERDRLRDRKINQNYSEIDEINKKLNEDNSNVRHYNTNDIDSFIRSRNYPR